MGVWKLLMGLGVVTSMTTSLQSPNAGNAHDLTRRRSILGITCGALAPVRASWAAPSPIPRRDALMYMENLCELNVFMLLSSLKSLGVDASAVVGQDVRLYRQRGGDPSRDGLKGWDFHVFCVTASGEVLDFESNLAWPTPADVWVADALRPNPDATTRRRFRLVSGEEYLARAKTAGPEGRATFLTDFVDPEHTRGPGVVLDEVDFASKVLALSREPRSG